MTVVGHRLRVNGEDQHGAAAAGTDPASGIDVGGQVYVVPVAAVQASGADRVQRRRGGAVIEPRRWSYGTEPEIDRYGMALVGADPLHAGGVVVEGETLLVVVGDDRVQIVTLDA